MCIPIHNINNNNIQDKIICCLVVLSNTCVHRVMRILCHGDDENSFVFNVKFIIFVT